MLQVDCQCGAEFPEKDLSGQKRTACPFCGHSLETSTATEDKRIAHAVGRLVYLSCGVVLTFGMIFVGGGLGEALFEATHPLAEKPASASRRPELDQLRARSDIRRLYLRTGMWSGPLAFTLLYWSPWYWPYLRRIAGTTVKARQKTLDLSGSRVTDSGLERVVQNRKDLECLNLRNTQISDNGLVHLRTLTALQEVDLRGAKVSNQAVRDLRVALPNCVVKR